MYDSRVGRWLSLDAYFKDYPSTSNYAFVRNSPTIRIDPDGNTDFYFNGRSIGTDGEENGLIGLVESKDVKKDIKKGRYKFPKKQLSQGEYNDFIVIDYNILETSNKILKKSISEGQKKEFGTVMKKDEESGKFEISENGIVEGPEVEWDSGKTGSVDFEDFEDGDITIHSHRTGQSKKTGKVASSDHPSKPDRDNVEYQPLQIIVGKKGDAVIRPGGIIEDNRTKSIEFYKEDPAKSSYSLSDNQAEKILKDQNKRQTK